jgi:predicted MFS family arabinose efflux permease
VAVTLFAAHESRDDTVARTVDIAGIATLSTGLTALVLSLVEGNSWGWASARILALLTIAVVGLAAFAVVERRVSKVPMVDFAFFRSRTFVGANTVGFIVSFSMLAMFFFLALYMQNILGYSALQAGVRFLPSTLVIMVVAPLSGRLADRIGPRPLIALGLTLTSFALFLQTRIDVHTSYGLLLPAFMIMGAGIGLTMSPMSTAAMNSVNPDKAGVASGTLSMNRMLGGTFGVAALGALFQHLSRHELAHKLAGTGIRAALRDKIVHGMGSAQGAGVHLHPAQMARVTKASNEAFVHALSHAMWLSMGFALLGVGAALVLIERKRAPEPDPARQPEAAAEAVGV